MLTKIIGNDELYNKWKTYLLEINNKIMNFRKHLINALSA